MKYISPDRISMPIATSIKRTISERLGATSSAKTTPTVMPITPLITPCNTKVLRIKRSVAPMVFNIAMAACLSLTAITSDDTMLKQATAMTSVKAIYTTALTS